MKNAIASFLLFVTLINITISKAEAGLGIISVAAVGTGVSLVASSNGNDSASIVAIAFVAMGVIYGVGGGILGTIVGGVVSIFNPSVGGQIIHASIVLEADGSLPQSALVYEFSKKYSFVDNQETIKNLASVVNQKYMQQKMEQDLVVVRLTENEVNEIFESSELLDSELAIIINDLK